MSNNPGSNFVLTQSHITAIYYSHKIGASLSLFLCVFVCLASLWIYSVPSARNHLDRVSFRLLVWSMVVEVVYNVVFLIGTNDTSLVNKGGSCAANVYILLGTMGVANWLCTAIGVNLMLAITFSINPLQAKLERWYLSLSFVLGFGVPLVPAILGHFGKDPMYGLCYFTQGNRELRIRDFVVDLYLWQLLSCLVAAVSVITVLITLLRQSRATERALFRGNIVTITPSELVGITSNPIADRNSRRSHMNRLQDKLTTIALKISLYPLALLFINVIITAEDLSYTSRGGIFNEVQYGIYWTHNFLYGGRGIFFALLGIFVDPCLRLGLPAAWKSRSTSLFLPPSLRRTPSATGMAHNEDQSIAEFLSTTGPETLDPEGSYPFLLTSRMTPLKGIMKKEVDGDVEKGTEEEEGVQHLKPIYRPSGDKRHPGLDVIISPYQTFRADPISPVLGPTTTPAPRTHNQQNWIEPLATAVLAQSRSSAEAQIRRRGSDPALGVAQKRRRELQAAAEEMYAQATMRL